MDTKKSIKLLIAFTVLLIIGVLITIFNGFELNFNYNNTTRIEIPINKQLSVSEVTTLISEVYTEEQFKVEMVGAFADTIGITVKEVNEEKNNQIIAKLNEKYGTELETTDITTYEIPTSTIQDIINPFIWPTAISFILILVATCIAYRKSGILKTIFDMLVLVIGAEILYTIIISIFNIKLTQTILIGAIVIMLFATIYLTRAYEKIKAVK